MPTRSEKMVRWFIFSVLVALTPLAFALFDALVAGRPATVHALVGDGELVLLSTAIAAASAGELIAAGRDRALGKVLAGGTCILLVLVGSIEFAAIHASTVRNVDVVALLSLWLFAGTVLAGASSIYLAHQEAAR